MILVTIGTSVPFDRLLEGVRRIRTDERVIVQRGLSGWCADSVECVDFMSYPALVEHVRSARLVVTHAGVGSILVCLQNGKRPIVTPRLHRFGEAVDDHQVDLGRRLHDAGVVTLVEDLDLLPGVVEAAAPATREALPARRALADDLREYLTVQVLARARTQRS